jgi:hypothetical protein
MCKRYDAQIKDFIVSADTPSITVKKVEARDDYTLLLTFSDGKKKLYNFHPLLENEIYKPLKNIEFFKKAKAVCGSVRRNDDIDIAPEELYDNGQTVS